MNSVFGSLIEDIFGFWRESFSDSMHDHGMYSITFWLVLGFALGTVGVYYYLVDHPRMNRWWHWLGFGISGASLLFASNFFLLRAHFVKSLPDISFVGDIVGFGLIATIQFFITYAVLSIGLKWWSKNCSKTPF